MRPIMPAILAAALAAAGCASEPSFGERIVAESQGYAGVGQSWIEGQEKVERGEDLIERGEDRVADGERDLRRGRDLVREGERQMAQAERDYGQATFAASN